MTENAVIPSATQGLCPWLTAKDVATPAPKPAVTAAPMGSRSEFRLYIIFRF